MDENMIDVGIPRVRGDITTATPEQPAGKNYPSLRLTDANLDFLKDYSVGDTVKVCCELKMTGVRQAEAWDDAKGSNYYDMEVKRIGLDNDADDK